MQWVLGLLAMVAATALVLGLLLQPDASRAADACVKPKKLGVVFVIDDSGSMLSNDPSTLRGSAVGVGLDQLPDGSAVAVSKFSTDASTIVGPTALDAGTRASTNAAVAGALQSTGSTDYTDGFTNAKAQLDAMTDADRKAVIFLSDGAPNSGFVADASVALVGVPVYTVGFGTVNPQILQDIATKSSGAYFSATSAGDLQAIFGRTVSGLTCDQSNVTETFTLAPGVTRVVPFVVSAGDGSFRALATWSTGTVGVRAIRPDQSAMTPASLRTGEAFNLQPTYGLLEGLLPAPGTWGVELTADASNAAATNVTIDVFKRALAIKRPAAIQVFCNRSAQKGASAPCTATVGDAGAPPRQTPTGTVNFTATRGAPAAGSCQLASTPLSPGIASCAIQYTPSDKDGIGVAFPVTAVYAGDGVFEGTTGVHRLVNAGCIETNGKGCASGVSLDLPGSGSISSTSIPMTVGCGSSAAKAAQTGVGAALGADMCSVSVVVNGDAKDAAKQMSASEFANGNGISFGELPSGSQTLAHELAQTSQTRTAVIPNPPAAPTTGTTGTTKSGALATAAAKKKKKKAKGVDMVLGGALTTVAVGKKATIKVKLGKRGKAIRKLYRALHIKTMPVTVYVRFQVGAASKPVTVKKRLKLKIK